MIINQRFSYHRPLYSTCPYRFFLCESAPGFYNAATHAGPMPDSQMASWTRNLNTNTNVNSPNHRARKQHAVIATHIFLTHTHRYMRASNCVIPFAKSHTGRNVLCDGPLVVTFVLLRISSLYGEEFRGRDTDAEREKSKKNYIHTAVHEIARRRCGCDPSQATNIYFRSGCGGTVHRSLIILYGSKCILYKGAAAKCVPLDLFRRW